MTRYMLAQKEVLFEIYTELKSMEKMTLKDISNYIGSDFRNALYKGYGLKESSFFKLESLIGYVIPTVFYRSEDNLDDEKIDVKMGKESGQDSEHLIEPIPQE